MRTLLFGLVAALAIPLSAPACPPDVVPDDGGSFGFGGYGAGFGAGGCGGGGFGYGAGSCGAPAAASFGYGAMVAAPSYSASYYAMPVGGFGRPRFGGGFRGGYGGFRGGFGGGFRGSFRGSYGGAVVAAPMRVHYAAPVVAAPVVAAPIYGYGAVVAPRAPGPFRGAVQGFFGGLKNRLNGF